MASLASELGADAEVKGIMPDTLDQVEDENQRSLTEADIVVTIGGTSWESKILFQTP